MASVERSLLVLVPAMTKPVDHTLEVLKQIRDAVTRTNDRLDQTVDRLDRVERRQTEMEIRLATEITAVVGAVHSLRDAILEDRHLRRVVDDHEQRLAVLERRTG
jgi:hypothetical protein